MELTTPPPVDRDGFCKWHQQCMAQRVNGNDRREFSLWLEARRATDDRHYRNNSPGNRSVWSDYLEEELWQAVIGTYPLSAPEAQRPEPPATAEQARQAMTKAAEAVSRLRAQAAPKGILARSLQVQGPVVEQQPGEDADEQLEDDTL